MIHKNDDVNFKIDENDFEIEYNDDEEEIITEKTKSLKQFPLKLLSKQDFSVVDIDKKHSKSLNFNLSKCFAPIQKFRHSCKNPSPIFTEKKNDIIINMDDIIKGEALTDIENSMDSESSNTSDFYEDNNQSNELNKISLNNNDFIISKKLLNKIDDKNEIIEKEPHSKSPKYKSISFINKKNIKSFRNSLFKFRLKNAKIKNKEVEYNINEKIKKKYGLELNIKTKKRSKLYDDVKIIPINEEIKENEDFGKFRKTIGFNISKSISKNQENKGITIYDALITNKKNKIIN